MRGEIKKIFGFFPLFPAFSCKGQGYRVDLNGEVSVFSITNLVGVTDG
jgi:hypothetical protein